MNGKELQTATVSGYTEDVTEARVLREPEEPQGATCSELVCGVSHADQTHEHAVMPPTPGTGHTASTLAEVEM